MISANFDITLAHTRRFDSIRKVTQFRMTMMLTRSNRIIRRAFHSTAHWGKGALIPMVLDSTGHGGERWVSRFDDCVISVLFSLFSVF